jgi:cation transport ATPase
MLNMSDNPTMINKMKVSELQAELTKRHLDTTGIKQVLVNRLLPSMEIVEPETANDDEQQNKAEGNMELAHDEGQDDSKDDRQDDSKDENKSSLNELQYTQIISTPILSRMPFKTLDCQGAIIRVLTHRRYAKFTVWYFFVFSNVQLLLSAYLLFAGTT